MNAETDVGSNGVPIKHFPPPQIVDYLDVNRPQAWSMEALRSLLMIMHIRGLIEWGPGQGYVADMPEDPAGPQEHK